jgi:hypothetical protein
MLSFFSSPLPFSSLVFLLSPLRLLGSIKHPGFSETTQSQVFRRSLLLARPTCFNCKSIGFNMHSSMLSFVVMLITELSGWQRHYDSHCWRHVHRSYKTKPLVSHIVSLVYPFVVNDLLAFCEKFRGLSNNSLTFLASDAFATLTSLRSL